MPGLNYSLPHFTAGMQVNLSLIESWLNDPAMFRGGVRSRGRSSGQFFDGSIRPQTVANDSKCGACGANVRKSNGYENPLLQGRFPYSYDAVKHTVRKKGRFSA